ncbi:MAG: GlsB/YeaQ/YmgE family stress response membrane protein [Acidobacteriia bacterium]|nr:GlsB/YeaQ/YmgE family stress response membrane protein [Terriglobia bacterium]
MLHMIGHMIFGLVIGLLARAVMPGRQHMGLIMTMLLGLVGAWVGGLIGRAVGMYPPGHPAGFLMALLGAVAVLLLYSWAVSSSAALILLQFT